MNWTSAILRNTLYRSAVLLLSTAVTVLLTVPAHSDPLSLTDSPLFLSTAVKPNLILAVDDSGSMDFEVLLPGNDGSAWWRRNTAADDCSAASGRSFTGCISDGSQNVPSAGELNYNHSGSGNAWRKYSYLFPNGCNSSNNSHRRRVNCNSHHAIPPLPEYAWSRSPAHNRSYFDPNVLYEPWPDGGGRTFTDASPTAARFDPVFGNNNNAIDLTRDLASDGSVAPATGCSSSGVGYESNWGFRIFEGMVIPANTCLRVSGGGWRQLSSARVVGSSGSPSLNNNAVINIRYFPATFYLRSSADLPSGYGYTGTTLTGQAPDGSSLIGYEIKPGNFATTSQYEAAIQNFANWFTYYRKRHQALRAGLGGAFNGFTGTLIGGFTINNRTNVTMREPTDETDLTDIYRDFYVNFVRTGGTPNSAAVRNLISQFRRTDNNAPVQFACQQNFGMLFTDGFTSDNASASVGNVDGSEGAPYADNVSNTMADSVMDAYLNALRSGTGFPAGRVPIPAGCNTSPVDPSLDCNSNLHMNFFAVTLGTRGIAFDPDNPADPYATPPTWPTSFPQRHPNSVDDIWHATINGRGTLLNANTPTEISDKLGEVLDTIIARTSSASSASVNSGSLSSTTRVYQAKFNTSNWTGQLLSFPVNDDGSLAPSEWDAGEEIPAAAGRTIITVNSNGSAVPFQWSRLDVTRQGQLQPGADSLGPQRLSYLRGDASQEVSNGGPFRARTSKLGDIVASSPVFVGAPPFLYPDSLESARYSTFRANKAARTQVVYAGANDGMLHGFNAATGAEIFGFVPSAAFDRLHLLTNPTYAHRYYVDGPPNMGDVFFGGAWHTVLVGGLNKGGQSIYALDVTNPGAFSEAAAANVFLWEFDDSDDADLGFTFSQPAIVRMANGKWAAVFGNGYNNTAIDGNVSSTGDAVLYVVDIQTGALIKKLSTQTGTAEDPTGAGRPNGLATPAAVDINSDFIVDYIYAGDLFGNLWKFDVTDSSTSNWSAAYTSSGNPAPLFRARDGSASANAQPITTRPEVGRGPNGRGMIVLFGTGKYLEPNDKDVAKLSEQTFYGIVDLNTGSSADIVSGRTELQEQTITDEFVATFGTESVPIRVTSDTAMGASKRGWYLDLDSPVNSFEGEMQVSNSILRNGRIIFTTLIPEQDPCGFGGTSWLMEMDALSGSRLDETPFDLNLDGEFDDSDYVSVTLSDGSTMYVPVSGRKSEEGIMPTVGILAGDEAEYKYAPGTTGNIQVITENPGVGGFGRQSWRQTR